MQSRRLPPRGPQWNLLAVPATATTRLLVEFTCSPGDCHHTALSGICMQSRRLPPHGPQWNLLAVPATATTRPLVEFACSPGDCHHTAPGQSTSIHCCEWNSPTPNQQRCEHNSPAQSHSPSSNSSPLGATAASITRHHRVTVHRPIPRHLVPLLRAQLATTESQSIVQFSITWCHCCEHNSPPQSHSPSSNSPPLGAMISVF